MINVVEQDPKKAMLVDFAKGAPIGSTLDQVQDNTAETVSILRSLETHGGFVQQTSVVGSTPFPRAAEPVEPKQKAILEPKTPVPIIVEKVSSAAKKDTAETPIVNAKKAERVEPQRTEREPVKPSEEDLGEARKNQGFIKGIRDAIVSSFRRQEDGEEKRNSLLTKSLSDQNDATEAGMLGLLGPIAPAIQETVGLIGGKDKDSAIGRFIGKFRKKKPDEPVDDLGDPKKDKNGRARDKKGRLLPAEILKKDRPLKSAHKTEADSDVIKKLDILHDDLVSGDKDQEKRDKKMAGAFAAGGGATGGIMDFIPGFGKKTKAGKGLFGKIASKTGGLFGKIAGKTGLKKAGIAGLAMGGGVLAKMGMKTGAKGAGKVGLKTAGKIGAKGIGKSLLKKIPGIGAIAGLAFGAQRLMEGDSLGALGEVASGLASMVPGIGTAASVAIDAALIARDVSKEGTEKLSEQKPSAPATVETSDQIAEIEGKKADEGLGGTTKALASAALGMVIPGIGPLISGMILGDSAEEEQKQQIERLPYGQASGEYLAPPKFSAIEDRSQRPRGYQDPEKKAQKKIDISNEKLLSEAQTTNELLAELVEDKKQKPLMPAQDDYIPNGIDNESDIRAINGLDEYGY